LTTRSLRIAQFTTDKEPEANAAVELLCEDHNGTYALPFPCRRIGDGWCNQTTGEIIEAEIIAWRAWKRS
jgi:hypothetical protein